MNLETNILKDLQPHANSSRAAHDIGYLRSAFPTLGCSMPSLRTVASAIFRDLESSHSHADIRERLDRIWKTTRHHEIMTICLLYFSNRKPENTLSDWRTLKTWANKIDNWAHSDTLSDIYADILDRHHDLYQTFSTWNADQHPWKRRLSLTSLLYYSSQRKHPLPAEQILLLVNNRIHDDHFYVQRAVGWTLRECGNLYPKKTEAFVTRQATELSSAAFSTATEKWDLAKKKNVLSYRHAQRRKEKKHNRLP